MKCFLLFLPAIISLSVTAQTKSWKVFSPDKSLQVTLSNEDGKIFYSVLSDGDIIIKASRLGIEAEGNNFLDHLSAVSGTSRKVDEHYIMKIGKRKINHAVGNETAVTFINSQGAKCRIILRAYNDGIAFRYHFLGDGKNLTVTNERTEFSIPEGKVWLENYDMPSDYTPAYEGNYANGIPTGTNAKDQGGWAFPAMFQLRHHWLLLTESDADGHYFGAHLQQDCTDGVYKIALPLPGEARRVGNVSAVSALPFATPWRVIITGRTPATIVESNLVYDLADSNMNPDDRWVKPGRSSWSWWSDHPSSKDFVKLKKYVDLAATMGWEYSLVDANWNSMKGGDIESLVQYANTKHIGLTLWYNSGGPHNNVTEQPRNIMSDPVKRKDEFHKLHNWGIKAVKVDFFQSDKQQIMQLYLDILKDAAKEKIMVVFHGCTLPRGWSRTYTNLLSMEAVKGAEQYGWDKNFAQYAAEHNTILAFTRNVVGPMDYTPVTFSDYSCCPHTTTNAHELALSVAFESGMLHFADSDFSYLSQPDKIKDFLSRVPNTWDDIKFLQGEPGKGIVLARRSGDIWYIAGINGEDEHKQIAVDFSFLNNASKYSTTIFSDDTDPRTIQVRDEVYSKDKSTSIHVLPKGGFVIRMVPLTKK